VSHSGYGWIVPAPGLALLAAIAAPAWLVSHTAAGLWFALAVSAAVIALVTFDLVTLPPAKAVTVTRTAPERTGLGEATELTYSFFSDWRAPIRLTLYQDLPAAFRWDPQPLHATLATRQAVVTTRVVSRQRGVHELGRLRLRLRGRLRLLARAFTATPGDSISVAPSLAPVRRFRLRALQARTRDSGPRVLRHRGESLTFAGLRAYAPGDDPRRIDWKATARQRIPITREYNLEQGQTVILAVDAGRLMLQEDAGVPRFEHALSATVVLATVAADAGDKVGLLVFDDSVRFFLPPRAGIPAVRAIRDALVGIQPSLVEPDYAAAFATIAASQRRRSLVVLFSDVIDARSSRALIAHTTRSAPRHLHLVVAMRNEALFRAGSAAGRGDAERIYFTAAAEELVLAREEALQRMRRSGVGVVDVAADALSAAVVDRYLEIKGRGSL
jgi:uncharacterized protein (DUF58 family)